MKPQEGLEPQGPTWAEGLSRKLGIMTLGTLIAIGLGFVISLFIARMLGPARLANYAAVTTGGLVLAQLNDTGLGSAFGFYARQRPGALRPLLTILARHLFVCLAVTVTAVWAAGVAGGTALKAVVTPAWFSGVLILFIALGTAANVLPVLLMARGQYRRYVVSTNLGLILQLGGVLVVALFAGSSWRGFVLALTFAQTIVVLWQLVLLMKVSHDDVAEHVTAAECYSYGVRSKWAEVMKILGGRADLLILTLVLSSRDVGFYSVASSFRELGMTPLRTYAGVLQNLLADRERDGIGARDLVIGSLLMQAALSTCLACASALIFPFALPLFYGSQYAGMPGPAAVLFCSTIFLSVAGLCWIIFNMWGRPGLTSRIVTVAGVLGPGLVWVLAQRNGLYGAALAGVLGAGVVCAISLFALARLGHYTVHDVLVVARRMPALLRDLRLGAIANVHRIVAGSFAGPS